MNNVGLWAFLDYHTDDISAEVNWDGIPNVVKFTRDIESLRISTRAKPKAATVTHTCQWQDCGIPAPYRAPQSPERLREYYWFCSDHVREYNSRWNFFEGMNDTEIKEYIHDNITGHRPTWKNRDSGQVHGKIGQGLRYRDRYNLFGDPSNPAASSQPTRRFPAAVSEAFLSLGLAETASLKEIKVRYKELVKRFHPDANGGDRATEGKLKQVIQAYNRLRTSGIK